MQAPNSALPSIIGPAGANINAIREKTGARIDVPRRENDSTSHADEDEEPTTTVTISAPAELAREARTMILNIIGEKKARSTRRIRDIPAHILPFIKIRRPEILSEGEQHGEVTFTVEENTNSFVITGDRDAVKTVYESVTSSIENLNSSLTPIKMGLPKKQHRLLTPAAVLDILQQTNCVVTTPAPEDPDSEIQVWGNIKDKTNISSGLQAVISVGAI